MTSFNKDMRNIDGSVSTLEIKSDDNYKVNLNKNYTLVKHYNAKSVLKNSLLGMDIGIHSNGFANIIIISSVIVLGIFMIIFFGIGV